MLNIDIGGTKIKAKLIKNGKIVRQISIKTPKNKQKFIKILNNFLKQFSKSQDMKNINIGCAGVIMGNKVIFSPNIHYLKIFDFRAIFPKPLNLKLDNDVRFFLKQQLLKNPKFKNKKILAFTIGTGIGRGYAINGKVKKIKKLEYPERWEKQYQKIRDTKNNHALEKFLSEKLSLIAKKYNPNIILLSGGVFARKNFFLEIKNELLAKLKSDNKQKQIKIVFIQ